MTCLTLLGILLFLNVVFPSLRGKSEGMRKEENERGVKFFVPPN
jgi:hypothetical protein